MDLNCPYCDAELEICHDDGFGYEEGIKHQMDCDNCNKTFVFETSISFDFEPEKADCLNGLPHVWKAQTCYPREFALMECSGCGEIRKPTETEKKEILTKNN